MKRNSIKSKALVLVAICLAGCSVWSDEFEGEVVRAYPQASIHQISKMMDKGTIQELSGDVIVTSNKMKVFEDGEVSRGVDDVRRIYMTTYEDSAKNLHMAHHLYFVVRPASWKIK